MSRYIDADYFLKEYCKPYPEIYKAMSAAINHMPTADVVPVKHGHWVEEVDPEEDCWNEEVVTCSCCDEPIRVHETDNTYFLPTRKTLKYCPNCGAKMDAERDKK